MVLIKLKYYICHYEVEPVLNLIQESNLEFSVILNIVKDLPH